MQKQQKYHHSVTEDGNLQLRIVAEYQDDAGKVLDTKYSDAHTPKDVKNMDGFDDRSKDIVAAINTSKVKADFKFEKQELTGIGIEEIVKHDRVINEDGKIAVRRIIRIYDEGKEVSKKYHRSWIIPGDNPDGNDVISKAVAIKLHTPEIIKTYKDRLAEQAKIQEPAIKNLKASGGLPGNYK